ESPHPTQCRDHRSLRARPYCVRAPRRDESRSAESQTERVFVVSRLSFHAPPAPRPSRLGRDSKGKDQQGPRISVSFVEGLAPFVYGGEPIWVLLDSRCRALARIQRPDARFALGRRSHRVVEDLPVPLRIRDNIVTPARAGAGLVLRHENDTQKQK